MRLAYGASYSEGMMSSQALDEALVSRVRNATIGRFITIPPPARPRIWFSEGTAVIHALDAIDLHYPKVRKEGLKELAAAKRAWRKRKRNDNRRGTGSSQRVSNRTPVRSRKSRVLFSRGWPT
jgi:hypothetical protein